MRRDAHSRRNGAGLPVRPTCPTEVDNSSPVSALTPPPVVLSYTHTSSRTGKTVGQAADTTGEFSVRPVQPVQPDALLPVLTTLATHPEGAIVATLAQELGASVGLVERHLRYLRAQGLVSSAFEGVPPVLTWRAA